MSNSFYSRYVPPSSAKAATVQKINGENSQEDHHKSKGDTLKKRKRQSKDSHASEKTKKSRHEPLRDDKKGKHAEGRLEKSQVTPEESTDSAQNASHAVIDATSVHSVPDKVGKEILKEKKKKKRRKLLDEEEAASALDRNVEKSKGDSKRSKPRNEQSAATVNGNSEERINESISASKNDEDDDEVERRHANVMSKFKKSLQMPRDEESQADKVDEEEAELPVVNDLKPLTLPERTHPEVVPTFSPLPSWLSEPLTAKSDSAAPFDSFQIEQDFVQVLAGKGMKMSLPVQSACLPLLLPTENQHPGDVCVSAATGSGKTLAYALPIVQDLSVKPAPILRALVIVPTRELVRQVQETFEMFVSKTGLKLGTATGTQSLQKEQDKLICETWNYDPNGYAGHQKMMHSGISLANDADNDEGDSDGTWESDEKSLYNHVRKQRSNIDILICTPGRLVDHIKSTKGFDLSQLKWLVIDEADKLLDESFQEWTEILIRNLADGNVQKPSNLMTHDLFLSNYMAPRAIKHVRKVILSATMTKDLDKLNTLKLKSPKLVLLEGSENPELTTSGNVGDASGVLTLPSTLKEHAVPVEDGSEKPLYLIQLLRKIFNASLISTDQTSSNQKPNGKEDDESDALSGSDSSDSASTSSNSSPSSPSDSPISQPSPTSLDKPKSTAQPNNTALIFTPSTEAATRLSHLLSHLTPTLAIHTLTKTTPSAAALTPFHSPSQHPRVLISTDRAARGLDIPHLPHVVNYVPPRSAAAYVHRVGRTARAGRAGSAWTLVEGREAAWFWNEVARAQGGIAREEGRKVERVKVRPAQEERGRYAEALEALREGVASAGRKKQKNKKEKRGGGADTEERTE